MHHHVQLLMYRVFVYEHKSALPSICTGIYMHVYILEIDVSDLLYGSLPFLVFFFLCV